LFYLIFTYSVSIFQFGLTTQIPRLERLLSKKMMDGQLLLLSQSKAKLSKEEDFQTAQEPLLAPIVVLLADQIRKNHV